jgi:hypothetical protein|tara:strand:+ start:102 stop:452 length:351 start_codon:yes stop_codon:yes gene_type:complete
MANIYTNAKKDLTTNAVTTLYTAPSKTVSIVKSIIANEKTNQATTITLVLYDGNPAGGATGFNIYTNKAISGYETLQLLTEPLVMKENEVLQVTAGHANRCVITASLLEVFDEKSA